MSSGKESPDGQDNQKKPRSRRPNFRGQTSPGNTTPPPVSQDKPKPPQPEKKD